MSERLSDLAYFIRECSPGSSIVLAAIELQERRAADLTDDEVEALRSIVALGAAHVPSGPTVTNAYAGLDKLIAAAEARR